jgi:hypothetical protein
MPTSPLTRPSGTSGAGGWWCATLTRASASRDRGGCGRGPRATGGRPAGGPGYGRVRFRSVLLPPWCRKSPKVADVLPLLYLHGLSTGDFGPTLEAFFGSSAGLSAAAITRLVAGWQAE